MSDDEYDWGQKKMTYYSMNKQENDDDSDFIEEEKEAIRIQNKKLEKIKQSKLLTEESLSEGEEDEITKQKEEVIKFQEPKQIAFPASSIIEDLSTAQNTLNEIIDETIPTLDITNSPDFFNIPKTNKHLQNIKNSSLSYAVVLLFSALSKLNNNLTNHHPSIKTLATFNYLFQKNQETSSNIQTKIDKLLELYQAQKIKEKNQITKTKQMLNKKTKRPKTSKSTDENDFVNSQIKNFSNMKQQVIDNSIKRKEKLRKEIEMKNELGIRKANKEVLKARGIYRKRKQYQGNAKIMNRLKYYKKQKLRSKMVKEYEGKPDVYSGEATGIRRDYIRSRQIKS
jgi:hypothetical protein